MFSLASIMMVLHHVEDLDLMLRETNRIMILGGYVIIKEHDASTCIDYMLIDIEHMLYDVVTHDRDESCFTDYYGKYYDKFELALILSHYGFSYLTGTYVTQGENPTVSATKSMIHIYKKVIDI